MRTMMQSSGCRWTCATSGVHQVLKFGHVLAQISCTASSLGKLAQCTSPPVLHKSNSMYLATWLYELSWFAVTPFDWARSVGLSRSLLIASRRSTLHCTCS